jgi:diguanylate cyclase
MQQQITLLQRRVDQARQETSSLQEKLIRSQHAMMTDHLTGLGNRRFYEATLNRAIRDVDESSGRAYLALIDCDEFKSVNDTFGHPFGDEVIKRVGRLMRDSKPDASIARLGGDEFAVFMRCNTIDEVESFAEHLRTTLDSQPIVNRETGDTIRRLTLSIGIAVVRSADDTASWHERADKLLYKAKRLGGNRAVIERFSTA